MYHKISILDNQENISCAKWDLNVFSFFLSFGAMAV